MAVNGNGDGAFKFMTRVLINCAGIESDKVAGLTGINKNEYRLTRDDKPYWD